MPRFGAFMTLLGCLLVSTSALWAASPLRVASEKDYPPFSYTDESGRPTGFDVDLGKALCAQLKRPCETVILPFGEIMPAVASGRVDVAVAGLARNALREQTLLYATPYYRSRTALVGLAGTFYPKVVEGTFAGKRLVAQDKSAQWAALQGGIGKDATLLATETVDEALQMVLDGKADVAFADSLSCMTFMNSEKGRRMDYVAAPFPVEHETSEAYIVVGRDNDLLAEEIRNALSSLRMSGRYKYINNKYFPFSIY